MLRSNHNKRLATSTVALLLTVTACGERQVQQSSKIDAETAKAEAASIADLNNAAAAIDGAAAATSAAADALNAPATASTSVSPSLTKSICKAAVAEINGRSPSIMKVTPIADGILRISYNRPDDGKLWKSDCKLEGNRIMWRSVDLSPGSGPGRWRNHPDDEVLTYAIKGNKVDIKTTWSDGSVSTGSQPL